jgi:hypothetical protein
MFRKLPPVPSTAIPGGILDTGLTPVDPWLICKPWYHGSKVRLLAGSWNCGDLRLAGETWDIGASGLIR